MESKGKRKPDLSNPIRFDSKQRVELGNLIDNLRQDIVLPKRKSGAGTKHEDSEEEGKRQGSLHTRGRTCRDRLGAAGWIMVRGPQRIPA